jgi:hypothetical protein
MPNLLLGVARQRAWQRHSPMRHTTAATSLDLAQPEATLPGPVGRFSPLTKSPAGPSASWPAPATGAQTHQQRERNPMRPKSRQNFHHPGR